ncbi:MAG: virulence factor [Rhodobacteraceae bacterium]|nr:virulence factor [Paracoccaceae bacterium]
MPEVTIVYWRDIPAQVIVGRGRAAAKRALPDRFVQAIDRAAMKAGLTDSDAYLAEWRRGTPREVEGDAGDVASSEAARLDSAFPQEVLAALIDNGGRASLAI